MDIKRALCDVVRLCGVCMINSTRCETIEQQGNVTSGNEAVSTLRPSRYMKSDDCAKGAITIWLCNKAPYSLGWYILRCLSSFASKVLLKVTKQLRAPLPALLSLSRQNTADLQGFVSRLKRRIGDTT